MFKVVVFAAAFVAASASLVLAAEPPAKPFDRIATIKALGYDPEAAADCKANTHAAKNENSNDLAGFLKASGEQAAEHAACPQTKLSPLQANAKTVPAAQCVAAAMAASGEITEHVSDMMNTEHPDVVAAYVDGVAQALLPLGDACKSAGDQVWAKVAAQAVMFQNRATTIREGRVCALWRLALDKELKAATADGEAKGKAAGLSHFNVQAGAALAGARQYCGADVPAGLIEANVSLTKMVIETMPDK